MSNFKQLGKRTPLQELLYWRMNDLKQAIENGGMDAEIDAEVSIDLEDLFNQLEYVIRHAIAEGTIR